MTFSPRIRWLLAAATLACGAAHAGTICSFTGTPQAGTDCMGHSWLWTPTGWSMSGSFAGHPVASAATDFHWTCLLGCGPITQASLQFGSQTPPWPGIITNGNPVSTVDFVAPSLAAALTVGQTFTFKIDTTWPTGVLPDFVASWTDDVVASVPEPASVALAGVALLAAGATRRRRA